MWPNLKYFVSFQPSDTPRGIMAIAETLLILVFVRTMYHWAQVARGRALWRDPLAPASAWVDEKTGGRVGHCEGDDAAITPA